MAKEKRIVELDSNDIHVALLGLLREHAAGGGPGETIAEEDGENVRISVCQPRSKFSDALVVLAKKFVGNGIGPCGAVVELHRCEASPSPAMVAATVTFHEVGRRAKSAAGALADASSD